MKAAIPLSEFVAHLDNYMTKRVEVFNLQPSSAEANRRDLDLFNRFMTQHGHANITGSVVIDFLAWLREERHNSPLSANRKISSLRTYLKWLGFYEVQGAADFPADAIPRMHHSYPGPLKTVEPEEVKHLLRTIDPDSVLGIRNRLLYGLLYSLGLRIGEAVGLDISDVDLRAGTIDAHGKGRRERTLAMTEGLPKLIIDWLAVRGQVRGAQESQALFLSKKGNRLSRRVAQENLQKLVRRAGPFSIDHLTPHSLRHAFATHALEDTQDIIILMAVLGHAKMESTQIYLHPGLSQMRAATNNHIAAEIIGDILRTGAFPIRMHPTRAP